MAFVTFQANNSAYFEENDHMLVPLSFLKQTLKFPGNTGI